MLKEDKNIIVSGKKSTITWRFLDNFAQQFQTLKLTLSGKDLGRSVLVSLQTLACRCAVKHKGNAVRNKEHK